MFKSRKYASRLSVIACACALSACTATYQNHGYVPPEEDLNALVVGADSKSTVDDIIGPPSMSGMGLADGGDYYYVRSRFREYGMFRPKVIDRRIVAISFDENELISNIEEFSLEDGRVVPLSRRVTDSSVLGKGFLRQLLGNIGQFDAEDLLGG